MSRNPRHEPMGRAAPHSFEVYEPAGPMTKRYLGLPGWDRRLLWYLSTPGAPEPTQWRTAKGEVRCVRCGGNLGKDEVLKTRACASCQEIVDEMLLKAGVAPSPAPAPAPAPDPDPDPGAFGCLQP